MAWPPALTSLVQLKINGQGWGSVENLPLANYAIGVPHPQNFFGYDPLTEQAPADPAEWPSSENPLYYYIDNSDGNATDTNNTYGYPDKPRLTVPEGAFTAGTVTKVGGGGAEYTIGGDGRWELTYTGSSSNPCFFVGFGASDPVFNRELRLIGCSHLIIDGIKCNRPQGANITVHGSQYWEFLTVRNNTFVGDESDNSGSVISCDGGAQQATKPKGMVVYNNSISNYGENTMTAGENDIHAFKPTQNVTDIWYIGNVATNLGGDCIQVGSANTPILDRVERVYIARNDMSNTLENAVDIKSCSDIIISQNTIYDFNRVNTGTADTEVAVIIHDDPDWVTCVANKISASGLGIQCTGGTNIHTVCNEIYDITPVGTYDSETAFGSGVCIHMRGGTNGYHVNNTMYDYSKGFQFGGTIAAQLYNNIFSSRNRPDGYEVMHANANGYLSSDEDYNLFYNPVNSTEMWRAGTSETLAEYQSSTSQEANAKTTDPEFSSPPSDFSIGASSGALDSGTVSQMYSDFEARYGSDIAFDIKELARPQGASWDIGANERAA